MVPALTSEQFVEGANAPPNLMAVNPAAAEAKPKIQVAKKANILASLQPQAQESPVSSNQPSPQPSPRASEAPAFQRSPRRPVVDDDMGIVRVERQQQSQQRDSSPPATERPNPMIPKKQVALKSRERDGNMTEGQKRAAAELERIKRDQARTATGEELMPPSPSRGASHSPRHSIASTSGGEPQSMDELLADIQKMKSILRQHERRIRLLEDQLADQNMADAYGL
ncbi:hypothetical protein L596_018934 [Steinernema carpocapsae]|uniref:Uncharacterized protein n=1 Tax=Steinernema carpocapsae TaxID=34508 RepID=A0A4U5N642_STECR|nr:hypothetical protein L596_018934 [Steinernema carpocapsae]